MIPDRIDRFTKESGYYFLSNFYPSTIIFEGLFYPTVEHAYQASKTCDLHVRQVIKNSKTPIEAKKLGKALQLQPDWNQVKIPIMRKLVKEKFDNPFLCHKLLDTGEAELIMNNFFNDRFWGVCRGTGENWLGKILMETRNLLRVEMKSYQDIQASQIE